MRRDSETGQFVGENDYSRSELLRSLRRYEREEGRVIRDHIVSHPEYPNRSDFESEFGTFSEAKRAAGLRNPGRYYLTESDMEAIDAELRDSDRIRELTYGLLMGDGTIPQAEDKNNCLRVKMISRPFLSWLADEYGRATRALRLESTAEESASQIRKTGFRPDAQAEDYHDIYEFSTRRLPYFTELRNDWYSRGEKQFPYNFDLTPLMAKAWYCGDGFMNIRHRYACIKCTSESPRSEQLVELFTEAGFDVRYDTNKIVLKRSETPEFLEWMGDPPPSFEYKWVYDDRERYEALKPTDRHS